MGCIPLSVLHLKHISSVPKNDLFLATVMASSIPSDAEINAVDHIPSSFKIGCPSMVCKCRNLYTAAILKPAFYTGLVYLQCFYDCGPYSILSNGVITALANFRLSRSI